MATQGSHLWGQGYSPEFRRTPEELQLGRAERAARRKLRRKVWRLMNQLPLLQYTLVHRHALDGVPIAELATELNMPCEKAAAELQRALVWLRSQLAEFETWFAAIQ